MSPWTMEQDEWWLWVCVLVLLFGIFCGAILGARLERRRFRQTCEKELMGIVAAKQEMYRVMDALSGATKAHQSAKTAAQAANALARDLQVTPLEMEDYG